MKMKRHFFISEDLDDLEKFEEELERAGVTTPQIHVLTLDDTGEENHAHLHGVQSIMKKDVIQSGEYGLAVGVVAAALVIGLTYMMEWYTSPAGWIPFIFLAIILLGFFTWEASRFFDTGAKCRNRGFWGGSSPSPLQVQRRYRIEEID